MAEQLELPEPSDPDERDEPSEGRDDPALALAARHALHDEELVAAYAAGTLEADEAAELARAKALVERCAVCRALHADLVTVVAAHRATARRVLAAPRDFRLSEADAARLRPDVPIVRAAPAVTAPAPSAAAATTAAAAPALAPAPPAASGPSFAARLWAAFESLARPLGGALVAAGLVGVLVGSISFAGMQAASVPLSFPAPEMGAPAPTAAAAGNDDDRSKDLTADQATVDGRFVVIGASVVVVLVGLGLLTASRRRARGTP